MKTTIAIPNAVPVDIGIPDAKRLAVAEGLCHLLADSYTLYLKTHNFHWNVTGPQFTSLHALFEQHYNELALAVDEIAERIRSLGFRAPGSYKEYAELTRIEENVSPLDATDMVRELLLAHETVARTARSVMPNAEEANDEVTADLLTQRLQVHEKTAWMLRSLLAV
ncbi:MAG: Dps family protein [Candidatus Melainabacteria bacterium]|nr:Dps family protein [Candidatus Melainabacteria bacterium]